MDEVDRNRSVSFSMVIQGLAIWSFIGALSGAGEVIVRMYLLQKGGTSLDNTFILTGILFYTVAWLLPGFVAGIILTLVHHLGARISKSLSALYHFVAAMTFSVLVLVGGYISKFHFPNIHDRSSIRFLLIFSSAVCIAGIIIFVILKILLLNRRTFSGYLERLHSPLFIVVLLLFFGSVIINTAINVPIVREEKVEVDEGEVVSTMPNVLILCIESIRMDHLSTYGYVRETSPQLTELADRGALFLRAFSQSSWTKPNVASILTARYSSGHGVNRMGQALSDVLPYLPDVLARNGYATGLFSSSPFLLPLFGFHRGVEELYTPPEKRTKELVLWNLFKTLWIPVLKLPFQPVERLEYGIESFLQLKRIRPLDLSATSLNSALESWTSRIGQRPFFAYVHYMEPHLPYSPPPPFDYMFYSDYRGDPRVQPPRLQGHEPFERLDPIDTDAHRFIKAKYDGEIAYIDREIGRLIEFLDGRDLLDHTILIVTSDHGQEFFEHGGYGHGRSLYNEVVQIPLIMVYPGKIPPGTSISANVRHIDIAPTIFDYCGIDYSEMGFDGTSLRPLLSGYTGSQQKSDEESTGESREGILYFELYTGGFEGRAIQKDGKKLYIANKKGEKAAQLFDLSKDPGEQQPLTDDSVQQHLTSLLEDIYNRSKSRSVHAAEVEIDTNTEEKLRSLGYLE
jgi:arylsulfatase A-like enzyme